MDTNPVDWCTIESDPGVFTELIKGWGVKNCQVEEIYSLEDEQLLKSLGEMYGLVFLFKWQKQEPREYLEYYDQDLFFCNQVIQNACATQALLAITLNNENIECGEALKEFKSFTKDFDAQTRGQALSNQPLIKQVHNSFQRPEPFGFYQAEDDPTDKKKGDAYHFISYVPFKGKVYELDGLQPGPILIGTIQEGQSWLDIAKQEINKRILKYSEEEIMFNLMAVIKNRSQDAEKQIGIINQVKFGLYTQAVAKNIELDTNQNQDFQNLKQLLSENDIKNQMQQEDLDKEKLQLQLQEQNLKLQEQQNIQMEEDQKKEKNKLENIRRKHNYLPFILELLKMTAKKGKLQELVKNAQEKEEKKQAEKQKQQQQKK